MARAASAASEAPAQSSWRCSTKPFGVPSAAKVNVDSCFSRSLKCRTCQWYGENQRSATSDVNAGLPPPSSSTNVCTASSSENDAASRKPVGPTLRSAASARAAASAPVRSMRRSSATIGKAPGKRRHAKTTDAIETSARPTQSAGFLVIDSRKRLVDRRARLTEELRAALSDVEAVLEADAELAVDGDHRLVAEAHARLQRRLVAAHEVRPLVAIETDTVAGPVGKTRHLVVGTEA